MTPTSHGTSQRLDRLIRFARSHGTRRALYRLANRFASVRWWKRWCRFTVAEIYFAPLASLKRSRRIPRVFTVRKATQNDLPALEDYFGDARRVRNRFLRGDACLVTLSGSKLGAAVWFTVGPDDCHEDRDAFRCVVRFPAGTCWTYDGRGTKLGAWGALMAKLPEHLEERAVEDVYTLIDYDNRESIDGHLSLGYRRAGLLAHFRCPGIAISIARADGRRWRLLPERIGSLELHRAAGEPAT